jgi:hypothetical protein
MSTWEEYPDNYRAAEAMAICQAVQAGECVSVVGLSGAGKSNLLSFLSRTQATAPARSVLVDANRLLAQTAEAFLLLMQRALVQSLPVADEAETTGGTALDALEGAILRRLKNENGSLGGICFLLDVSLLVDREGRLLGTAASGLYSNLRALRDAHKYRLTYVAATRHPLPTENELAELFYGRTLWLGPLAQSDALWNVNRYARRVGQAWPAETAAALVAVSGAYPALLRAVCEAHAGGAGLARESLAAHPAVRRRVEEFWADAPSDAELRSARLAGVGLLMQARPVRLDTTALTAKEHLLLRYFQSRPGAVCEKDDVIRAVWPEDQVFERGVRDDSLAQLVRRLREKIEPDPANPRLVHTVPGRGYRYTPPIGPAE